MTRTYRFVIPRLHKATFKGVHNASKSKVLILLYNRKYRLGLNSGLSAWQIHLGSGVNYDYLRSRLGKWYEWGYLSRRPVDSGKGRPVYTYIIAKRGEHFIEDIVPVHILNQYIAEINAFRSKRALLYKR